jgi:hypothetical protein
VKRELGVVHLFQPASGRREKQLGETEQLRTKKWKKRDREVESVKEERLTGQYTVRNMNIHCKISRIN